MGTRSLSSRTAGLEQEATVRTGKRRRIRKGTGTPWVAVPYFAFVTAFLVVPLVANLWDTFFASGEFSSSAFLAVFEPQYRQSFLLTAQLSAVTALIGGVAGLALAWALAFTERPAWLKSATTSFTALASQSGGVQLSFAFIAALGTEGLLTQAAESILPGSMAGFSITSFTGVTLVYLYFQIPLMAILMLPAMGSLRSSWYEAASSLGATRVRYARDVIFPILWPSIAGSLLLLFANAFAAYATAYALTGGGLNLVPILIGFLISGNVLLDPALAASLVTWMMLVIITVMGLRALLVRRSSRWMNS